jgi:hypothetical protein
VLSVRGLCYDLITRPEESYRLCCVVVCDLETSRIGAPYIYDISNLRVNGVLRITHESRCFLWRQNNPEVNYSPTRISGVGSVSRESITQQETK